MKACTRMVLMSAGTLLLLAVAGFGSTLTFDEIKLKAKQGDIVAQFELGRMYLEGEGVAEDTEEAMSWLRKAAEKGHAHAQFQLGMLLVLKDKFSDAARWLRKSAEQNDSMAQVLLGRMIEAGRGLRKSEEEAVLWYRKAAEQGEVEAQYRLAQMLSSGRGVKKDEVEAMRWCRTAAAKGNAKADSVLKLQALAADPSKAVVVQQSDGSYLALSTSTIASVTVERLEVKVGSPVVMAKLMPGQKESVELIMKELISRLGKSEPLFYVQREGRVWLAGVSAAAKDNSAFIENITRIVGTIEQE
jgi:hypothetical protein